MSYKMPNIKKIDPIGPPCKKTTYYSPEEAQAMANYVKENRTSKEIRIYNCLICGYWHLTSKTK